MLSRRSRKQWSEGDLVLHDRDSKEHRMIRRVTGFEAGLIVTRYAFPLELPEHWRGRRFRDRPEALHVPERFNVDVKLRAV